MTVKHCQSRLPTNRELALNIKNRPESGRRKLDFM